MAKAISYLRYSSSHQGSGSTLDRQQAMIDRWLASHPDVERSPLSQIDEGRSASKGEHLKHGLGAIIAGIESGEIKSGDYLLVEAIDRIGRLEPLTMVRLVSQIVDAGITIVTLEDNQYYSKETLNNEASHLFILAGKVQQAYEYTARLSQRISAGNKARLDKAKKGDKIRKHLPIWLTSEGNLKPKEAAMVRDCIKNYLNGLGARGIILKLKKKYPHLDTVHPSTLSRWFKNPAIKGDWLANPNTLKEETVKGVFDALITPEC